MRKEQQRSWVSLLTFCAVSVLLVASASAFLLAGATVAFAFARPSQGDDADSSNLAEVLSLGPQSPAAQPIDDEGYASRRIYNGMITDSRCGARHRMNSDKTSAECAHSCARNGASYVLVDGEKIYALAGDLTPLEKLAGERVNVSGIIEGDTITVKDVASAQPR
jgi:hypothetical protein